MPNKDVTPQGNASQDVMFSYQNGVNYFVLRLAHETGAAIPDETRLAVAHAMAEAAMRVLTNNPAIMRSN